MVGLIIFLFKQGRQEIKKYSMYRHNFSAVCHSLKWKRSTVHTNGYMSIAALLCFSELGYNLHHSTVCALEFSSIQSITGVDQLFSTIQNMQNQIQKLSFLLLIHLHVDKGFCIPSMKVFHSRKLLRQ